MIGLRANCLIGEGSATVDDLFRAACLAAALKTIDLHPLDILMSEDRVPRTVRPDEGRTARPTWVGRDYQPGGVMLIGKNPGGGSSSFETARPTWDIPFFDALVQLRDKRDMAAFVHLSDEAQPAAMRLWPMWRSIGAVLDALQLDVFSVAIGNLVPFRTQDNKVFAQEYERAWRLDNGPMIDLLRPSLIVKMTNEFPAFRGYCSSEIRIQQFHRANGDRYITPEGQNDLIQLRAIGKSLIQGDRKYFIPEQHSQGMIPMSISPRGSISDEYIFTYVRSCNDSQYEKKKDTAGHARFLLFKRGMTVAEFLNEPLSGNPPRRVDITYNLKPRTNQRSPNLVLASPTSAEGRKAREEYLRQKR